MCLLAMPSSDVEAVEGKVRCHIVGLWKSAFAHSVETCEEIDPGPFH
jgi:hypothetical protein